MVKEIKEFGPWSEQTSSSGRKYFYNRDTEVSQWEKPKEWREYELRLAEQERLNAEQERMQQQPQHPVVPPPPMFMTPPPFAFPPPFAPPGFPVGPMNAPPPPFPPYNQFQPPPNIPFPIPPRINSTISAPINTSFPPPPHPPAAPSPRVTQGIAPPPLIPPLVNVTAIPAAPLNAHFSPLQYSAPPPTTGAPPPLHPLPAPPLPAPPPGFSALPPPCTSANHDAVPSHVSRGSQRSNTPQPSHQQHHSHSGSHPPFSRDRPHVERSPRGTPPSNRQATPSGASAQQTSSSQPTKESSPPVVKREHREKSEETNGRATPGRSRPASEAPARLGPIKREHSSNDTPDEPAPSPAKVKEEVDESKPPVKKRDLVAQSLTLENKLVAELIKMKTAAALVAVQENEVCICNAKIQSLRELRHDLESRQSRLMAPAVVTMPDLNSRA
ncbi:hypothetical protein Q1695_009536 [Nippostrongylus brasiliensis]|nr:hypothetical protein Q1695_009536 [Nippostrongylus brasiliensis]